MGIFKRIFSKSRPTPQEGGIFFTEMQSMLGFAPVNINHYQRAFTHRSSNKLDEKGSPINYDSCTPF
jgi:ribonuclease III